MFYYNVYNKPPGLPDIHLLHKLKPTTTDSKKLLHQILYTKPEEMFDFHNGKVDTLVSNKTPTDFFFNQQQRLWSSGMISACHNSRPSRR
jgi:hypothetical protein